MGQQRRTKGGSGRVWNALEEDSLHPVGAREGLCVLDPVLGAGDRTQPLPSGVDSQRDEPSLGPGRGTQQNAPLPVSTASAPGLRGGGMSGLGVKEASWKRGEVIWQRKRGSQSAIARWYGGEHSQVSPPVAPTSQALSHLLTFAPAAPWSRMPTPFFAWVTSICHLKFYSICPHSPRNIP